jgi:hypothetical protein
MGTTNLSLAREDFLSFEVGQVSTEKQWLVALLQALEDKIGHNRKTSAQVEELIHATYVSRWRTNDGSIALADVVECHRDPVDPRQVGPDTVYVGLEHMTPHSLSLERHGSAVDVGSGKAAFQPGDILFGRLRPYFHKVAVAHTVGIASQEILVLRPRSPELLGLAVCETSNPALIDHATAVSTGTRMPRASWADIGRFRFGYRRRVRPVRHNPGTKAGTEASIRPQWQQARRRLACLRRMSTLADAPGLESIGYRAAAPDINSQGKARAVKRRPQTSRRTR